ncbi:MAG TPA: acetate--CoA ligase [Acidobacteriota bacterium]|nr:acetate--CoA ligase [Acidobacteriota bacterium]
MEPTDLDSVLEEQEQVPSPDAFISAAVVPDPAAARSAVADDPEAFWAGVADELEWSRRWDAVLDWDPPFARWFPGARCNIVHNAIDRHLSTWRRHKVALVWEGENGDRQVLTYAELAAEVNRLANGLRRLGIEKGDCVTIYMPICPQQAIAMLASAKVGAFHSVVFGGFSSEGLRDRINDARSKLLITADGGYYRGNIVPLKQAVDEAVRECPSIEHVVVYERTGSTVPMQVDRDVTWSQAVEGCPSTAETEIMEASDPLFVLYTSGSTGKPKGIVHGHGGYMVGVYQTTKWVFDLRDTDLYWCTADAGWITGHSYIVYGPLINGATGFMAEGAPDYPDASRWWRLIERYGINILYTAPTAVRMFMRLGAQWPAAHDLSSLRLLGTVGEPINPEAWRWYHRVIGGNNCPIVDTWWQTETGSILITNLPAEAQKPGSAGLSFPGIDADVVDAEGTSRPPGHGGYLVVRKPWPSMLSTIYNDPERYRETYWEVVPGMYTAGDAAVRDEDGYIRVLGRMDDVLNVAGHRLGTMEIESSLVAHPAVAEAAVIGMPDEIKGEVPKAFVLLQQDIGASDELARELCEHVGKQIGKIARPQVIDFVASLPKTRSGKIMRRLLKAQERGEEVGDTSTLDPGSVPEDE